jgi:acetyl-CoA acyltransferase
MINMGLTAENVAAQFGVSREDQDAFGYRSHTLASSAIKAGMFEDEIVPVEVETTSVGEDGEVQTRKAVFDVDEGVRHDSKLESMAKLPPVFKSGGSVTAGNSSQMSDGAAAVLVMEREVAVSLGFEPQLRLLGYATGGVPPEVMGMGPTAAVPKVLAQTGIAMGDIELVELNEAFAAQALAVIRQLGMDQEKTNVNGGAIALGHPLGCTGSKLTVQLMNEMKRRDSSLGMVTMCVGGGQGAAGIFERLN